jgi:hypothetical protein
MLGHREELHVGEAGLPHVVGELLGQLAVGQALAPRAEVHLVDAHRLYVRRPCGPRAEPALVVPLVGGLEDDARRLRRHLGVEREGVGLLPPDAVRAEHVELVGRAGPHARDEQLPDA